MEAMRWRRLNKLKKRIISDGRLVPDRNEEYLLYQTLVAAWPLRIEMHDAERGEFVRRIQEYMKKAVNEAKVNLSWTNQNPEYVEALEQFVARILHPGTTSRPNIFLRRLQQFLPAIQHFGCMNSLAQVLLKLTCPGVPDIYQGQESWDFSLVDPDNRRPVDFVSLQQALGHLLASANGHRRELCDEMLRAFPDDRLKLWTTAAALRFRRDHASLFQEGSYQSLLCEGEKAEHMVAFSRELEGEMAITAVPRLAYSLCGGRPDANAESCWAGTVLKLPDKTPAELENVHTGELLRPSNGNIPCAELFRHFPVALLYGR
jgi:(1->4)-alpha-D-glucan 1-alpha-D-glucosylmutase